LWLEKEEEEDDVGSVQVTCVITFFGPLQPKAAAVRIHTSLRTTDFNTFIGRLNCFTAGDCLEVTAQPE
jgi:hypothetical protein